MPALKASFARLKGFDPAGFQSSASRLKKVRFDINSDMQVLAVDQDFPRLTVEVALRRERESLSFDESTGKLAMNKGHEYRRHLFSLDANSGMLQTPGGRRDFNLLMELFKRSGAGSAELLELSVDLVAWTRQFLSMYESAQLAQVVYDNYFSEPKLIGRYSAKAVDNRADLKLIESVAASLRSIRLNFFFEGVRRSVEARRDAVLVVTSSDEEDAEHFFEEQRRIMLLHAALLEAEPA